MSDIQTLPPPSYDDAMRTAPRRWSGESNRAYEARTGIALPTEDVIVRMDALTHPLQPAGTTVNVPQRPAPTRPAQQRPQPAAGREPFRGAAWELDFRPDRPDGSSPGSRETARIVDVLNRYNPGAANAGAAATQTSVSYGTQTRPSRSSSGCRMPWLKLVIATSVLGIAGVIVGSLVRRYTDDD